MRIKHLVHSSAAHRSRSLRAIRVAVFPLSFLLSLAFVALSFCALPFCALPASAQPITNLQTAKRPASESYYGQTEAQMTARFGRPDEVRNKTNGSSEWLYGQSTLFFSGGKVSAWSDAGELAQRAQVNTLKRDDRQASDDLSGQWENPWTPPRRKGSASASLQDVIDQ